MRRWIRRALVVAVTLGSPLVGPLAGSAADIDYVEDFALASDRAAALKQLIPGTDEYYYYHALHYLNTEQYEQVRGLLKPWIERHQRSARVVEIETRLALLTFPQSPQATLDYLRNQLQLQFNHQRANQGAAPNLPTELDPKLIARETLLARALAQPQTTAGVEDAGLDRLVADKLTPEQQRHLLSRLGRPDYPGLVDRVLDDLARPNSPGFGAFPIHRQLLLAQLDELLKRKPDLLNQGNFVQAYLTKLHPGPDDDWRNTPAVRDAYFDRLERFVSRLAPVHNSLKAHLLYHRLVSDRAQGKPNKERFLAYLKLPRPLPYVARKYLEGDAARQFPVDVNANFEPLTLLPPVGHDEPVVRWYLSYFLLDAAKIDDFAPYIDDDYLKRLFAETKIVNGLGDAEQWASQLPPDQFRELRDRVDIDFAPTNPTWLAADAPVQLDVHLKNVSTLIVKVFEINTRNFYRDSLTEINTDINLDGLVANDERTIKIDESPLRRVSRKLEFPQLKGPGVYVIDLIGNGRSSRALVRKGRLRQLVRTTAAGQELTLLDERNQLVEGGQAWIDGREYAAGKDGKILIPFTATPGRRPIVLSRGDFASLDHVQHEGESYAFDAGIQVDRESLLARRKGRVVLRPSLKVNGVPISLSRLSEVELIVAARDLDGVQTMQTLPKVELFEDRETVHEFQTPGRLRSIEFVLRGKVKGLRDGQPIAVAARQAFTLNGIDETDKIEDLHLTKIGGDYILELRGRTGEPRPTRAIQARLKHREFQQPVSVTFKTDGAGRIKLGALPGIASVTAVTPEAVERVWSLRHDSHTYPQSLHGAAGSALTLPYLGDAETLRRDEISLLELRGDNFVADRFDDLELKNSLVSFAKLPPGDYDLQLKKLGVRVRIRVTAGPVVDQFALGAQRQLETKPLPPVQIARIDAQGDQLQVHVVNASKFTRVHVFAERYLPAFHPFDQLARVRDSEPYLFVPGRAETVYVTGRNIGDEYRYILDRRYSTKFPGNTLERPSLLLNPWAVRSTQTEVQNARLGEAFGGAPPPAPSGAERAEAKQMAGGDQGEFSNLDFLSSSAPVLANLTPNEQGVIQIPRQALGNRHLVQVVAVDPLNVTARSVALAEPEQMIFDLRLAEGLDPKGHFTQQKLIDFYRANEPFVMNDVSAGRYEVYDSLERVFDLFTTLSNDATLAEFRFVTKWPDLTPEEKRAKYSQYACHELNYFLYRKDPQFFREVVKPYLAHKKDKTFVDRWLLDEPLPQFGNPWGHEQLNIWERVLWGRRGEQERARVARHVRDLHELLPPNVDRFIQLFDTAVKGSALDAAQGEGPAESAARLSGAVPMFKGATAAAPARNGALASDRPNAPGRPGAPPGAAGAAAPDADLKRAGKRDAQANAEKERLSEQLGRRLEADKAKDGRAEDRSRGAVAAEQRKQVEQFYRKAAEQVPQLFRQLDPTKEWAENNYYHRPIDAQTAALITVNAFWKDFADQPPDSPFHSRNIAEASNNFAEMLLALASIDLPFRAEKHDSKLDGLKLTLTPGSPILVYHEEIRPAAAAGAATPILVSQNFFKQGDRHRQEGGEQVDKYVTEEFVVHTVYGCQVVVTNPTSSRQKLSVLTQIPVGAIPVLKSQATKTHYLTLDAYKTQTIEYYFYFPLPGEFAQFPVHVAKNEQLVAAAAPFAFHVSAEATKFDATAWDYVSQQGTNDEVLEFLRKRNVQGLPLEKIAFRMREPAFFEEATRILADRQRYHEVLWSYSILHQSLPAIREFLLHRNDLIERCGGRLVSPLLTIDPVARRTYEHLEYKPLVNARAHALGKRRQIVNDRFHQQYHRFLKQLSYQRELTSDDWLAVTYYLLLQDRIGEALAAFERVQPDAIATRMQYDYCAAYLAFYREDFAAARRIAQTYAQHPVDRWRKTFAAITAQLEEAEGGAAKAVDSDDRNQQQTQLAAASPALELRVEARKIQLKYQSLSAVRVNYYLMDVELLFSRNPFVKEFGGEFSAIRPNLTQEVQLPANQTSLEVALPESLANRNVLIEVVGGGVTKRAPYYSHSMDVQVIENYGQVKVAHAADGKPLPKVYVKVYARSADGQVKFYKDGYTDVRGRFDYASLSTNELTTAERFSILILSEERGAVVREAGPPAR